MAYIQGISLHHAVNVTVQSRKLTESDKTVLSFVIELAGGEQIDVDLFPEGKSVDLQIKTA